MPGGVSSLPGNRSSGRGDHATCGFAACQEISSICLVFIGDGWSACRLVSVEGALMLGVPPVSARAKRGQSRKYAKESILILTILRDLND